MALPPRPTSQTGVNWEGEEGGKKVCIIRAAFPAVLEIALTAKTKRCCVVHSFFDKIPSFLITYFELFPRPVARFNSSSFLIFQPLRQQIPPQIHLIHHHEDRRCSPHPRRRPGQCLAHRAARDPPERQLPQHLRLRRPRDHGAQGLRHRRWPGPAGPERIPRHPDPGH